MVDSEDLRISVYDRFRHGQRPTVDALAAGLSATVDQVRAGLRELAGQRHLVLGQGR